MFCEKCGFQNDNAFKFCKKCGHPLVVNVPVSEEKTEFIGSISPDAMQQMVQNPYEQGQSPYYEENTKDNKKSSRVPVVLLVLSIILLIGGGVSFFVLNQKASANARRSNRESITRDRDGAGELNDSVGIASASASGDEACEEVSNFTYDVISGLISAAAEDNGQTNLSSYFMSSATYNDTYNRIRDVLRSPSFNAYINSTSTNEILIQDVSVNVTPANGNYRVSFISNNGLINISLEVVVQGGTYKFN